MTRKCSLCGKKFYSTKQLSHHMTEEHKYQFLYKYCKCRRSYSSRNLMERHIRHHSPWYMCEECRCTSECALQKGYACTYPKCDHVYKSAAEYQRHLKKHHEPREPLTCSECDKSFDEKSTWINT